MFSLITVISENHIFFLLFWTPSQPLPIVMIAYLSLWIVSLRTCETNAIHCFLCQAEVLGSAVWQLCFWECHCATTAGTWGARALKDPITLGKFLQDTSPIENPTEETDHGRKGNNHQQSESKLSHQKENSGRGWLQKDLRPHLCSSLNPALFPSTDA